jgi:hypothetical protein
MQLQLSEGEIHYLWWFIQASSMYPGTRWRARRCWGFCERHSWGFISIEASFRNGWMHGPAILYQDLMGRAYAAFELERPFAHWRLARRLENKELCLMCEGGLGPTSKGMASREVVERGLDLRELRAFAGGSME